ncbi:NfeD family protein [Pseudofrankia sp. DC12]|uniref:NfeD family protein n=1 Tax=Pseudofrankia sp. DC12 TaxID=683315 RepID=UPI0005F7FB91|nr:NfeD family protein [Pseudofrankia sp. DC12]
MPADLVWFIVAGGLTIAELLTGGLYLLMFALAAAVAGIVALVGGGLVWELLAFVLAAGGLTFGLRPIAARHLNTAPLLATGAQALVGAEGVVLEQVDRYDGRVKIKGEIWSARAYPDGIVIATGSEVRVLRIDGATAIVHQEEVPGLDVPRRELP